MKKVAVLLAEGFEEVEALTVVDVMRRANIHCDMVSIGDIDVIGSHNIKITADMRIDDDLSDYSMIVLPGGLPGSTNLQESHKVINLVKEFYDDKKYIAAICAAPIVLAEAGIIEGKNITSYPGFEDQLKGCNYISDENVVVDGNIITSRGPALTLPFSYKLLEVLGVDPSGLKEGMMFNFLMR